MPVQVRLVCNQEFGSEIVRKVVDCSASVADTSELFLRSVQLCSDRRGRSVAEAKCQARSFAGTDGLPDAEGGAQC